MLDCPCDKSLFSYPAWTSFALIYPCYHSSCHNEPPWRAQLCPHSRLPLNTKGWLWGALKPLLHQAVQAPLSQPLLMRQLCQHNHLGAFPLSSLQYVDVYPVLEGPKLDIVCVSAGGALADAAWDAAGHLCCQDLLQGPAQITTPRTHSPELLSTQSITRLILFQSSVSSDLNNKYKPNKELMLQTQPLAICIIDRSILLFQKNPYLIANQVI